MRNLTSKEIVDFLKEETGDNNWYVDTKQIGTPANHRLFSPSLTRKHVTEAHKKLTAKQKKLAAVAGNPNEIDADDLAKLRATKEEIEQVDELKKSTLSSYVQKASAASNKNAYDAGKEMSKSPADSSTKVIKYNFGKIGKRSMGIQKAATKLAKEEAESVDESKSENIYLVGHVKPEHRHLYSGNTVVKVGGPYSKAHAKKAEKEFVGHPHFDYVAPHRASVKEEAESVDEKVVNKYAVGMAVAKKKYGYGSEPAHDLPKKVIAKGHEIAKKVHEETTRMKLQEFRAKLIESTTSPKVHDLTHMRDDRDVYDHTQTSDDIKDGDVMKLHGGRSAIMMKAWPVMHKGASEHLHALKSGTFHTHDGGKYKKSAELASSLKEHHDHIAHEAGVKEEVEQVTEGRPSQQHPLEGHPYHKKSNDELEYIAKDAHKAAEAMKSHNTTAENKYRDQASDSATVRNFRKKSGMPSWYKKKYSLGEEVKSIDEALDHDVANYADHVFKAHTHHDQDVGNDYREHASRILKDIANEHGPVGVRWAKANAAERIENHNKKEREHEIARVKANYKPTPPGAKVHHQYTKEEVDTVEELVLEYTPSASSLARSADLRSKMTQKMQKRHADRSGTSVDKSAAKAKLDIKPATKSAPVAKPTTSLRAQNIARRDAAMSKGTAHRTGGVGSSGSTANQSPIEKKVGADVGALEKKKTSTALGASPSEREKAKEDKKSSSKKAAEPIQRKLTGKVGI
ncbi:hypothetical protein UFOVP49_132 [uncultured Caudovirales phage]|uniref:Uncharacterized protein n=1 Tax=uncultured Caudovirales phage TaxID=2100421 RepID=A0A6J5KPK4_9CAUD|nr:hypothetical protein UFOVP49_132 [uncultured Caudovirales phage]